MTPRRRLLTALTAGLAATALTGCEKPSPIVTVVSGTTSEWREADVFCFEGQSLEQDNCAQRAEGRTQIPVKPGQQVGVDVGKGLVDRGWILELQAPGAEVESTPVQRNHYFAFSAPSLGPEGARLVVRTADQTGEWVFELVPE